MPEKTTKISLNVPDKILEKLDKLAEKAEIDRTKLIVNILNETSETLEMCGKVGIYQFAILLRNLSEKMQEWAQTVKEKRVDPL